MEKIESIRISLKKGIGYIGYAFGKTNIIRNHIAFFEKLAEKEINIFLIHHFLNILILESG
jgi:hypothetical protein